MPAPWAPAVRCDPHDPLALKAHRRNRGHSDAEVLLSARWYVILLVPGGVGGPLKGPLLTVFRSRPALFHLLPRHRCRHERAHAPIPLVRSVSPAGLAHRCDGDRRTLAGGAAGEPASSRVRICCFACPLKRRCVQRRGRSGRQGENGRHLPRDCDLNVWPAPPDCRLGAQPCHRG